MLGYTPSPAAGPAAALEICRNMEIPIDLVVSDVILPEMNGTELRDQITALRPGLPVLFISGYTSDIIGRNGILKRYSFPPKALFAGGPQARKSRASLTLHRLLPVPTRVAAAVASTLRGKLIR